MSDDDRYPLVVDHAVEAIAAVIGVALDDVEATAVRSAIRTVVVEVARAERDRAYARVYAAIEAAGEAKV